MDLWLSDKRAGHSAESESKEYIEYITVFDNTIKEGEMQGLFFHTDDICLPAAKGIRNPFYHGAL